MTTKLILDENAPWKQRYRASIVALTQVAKVNPSRGLACSNRSGIFQLYGWDVTTGDLKQLTFRPEGMFGGMISPDGRYIYYLDDKQGNEIGHYVRIPFEGGEVQDITPELPPYSSFDISFSRTCNRIGFTLATSEGFMIYQARLTPEGTLAPLEVLYQSTHFTSGPLFSADGDLAIVSITEHTGKPQFSLLAFDASTGEKIAELWDGPESSIERVFLSPIAGDSRLVATSNRSGFGKPFIWNPRSDERIDLPCTELEDELEIVDWSPDGKRLLLSHVKSATQQFYIYEFDSNRLRRLFHPSGVYSYYGEFGTYFMPDGQIYAQTENSTHPTELVALDGETGEFKRTILTASQVPPSKTWKKVFFRSADGQEIQAWLAVPDGKGPFPTILETHGGPEAVTLDFFHRGSQAWLDHGFAFMSINYRGSTTFGRQFQEKIYGNLGTWEVEDMAAAREYLIRQGIARPGQILLTGWSYGGYLTLLALGKRPDLWAGGMAGVAIADWKMNYEDSAETLRGYQIAIFGGTPQQKPEQYAASSPITYADKVKAPVLIIQGRNDTRTPARPVEVYEEKMKSLGKPIEVHWFEAGHAGSAAQVELSIQHQELMLRFAYRALGLQLGCS